jgi:hypothetical protein
VVDIAAQEQDLAIPDLIPSATLDTDSAVDKAQLEKDV